MLAQSRVPVAAPDLEALGVPARRIGDCDTPRSLEEAVLEATLAVPRSGGPAFRSVAAAQHPA